MHKMPVKRFCSTFYFRGGIAVVVLLLSVILAVRIGSVNIPFEDIVRIMVHKFFHAETIPSLPPFMVDIVYNIRLPRVILALFVGAGLSISGVVIQAVVMNSLGDPYILGISSGASLGATLAIVMGVGTSLGPNYVGISACIVAFLASLLVISIATLRSNANPMKLILAGVAVSSMFSALSSFIVYTSNNREGLRTVQFWLLGGLSGAKWGNMDILSVITLLSAAFFMSQYRTLNLMLLGDETAITLGKDLRRYRQTYLLVASLMTGFIVYNSGVIGFVGLIIPHVTRLLFGCDHRKTLPTSALLGAITLIWADVIARVIIPENELPVGIVLSLIGAPIFVYLLTSKDYRLRAGG